MKFSKLVLILPVLTIFSGCNSKNNSIPALKENAQIYKKLANSAVYSSKSSIVNLELKDTEVKISLLTKNRDDDLYIIECKDKNNIYTLNEIGSDNFGKHYIIKLPKIENSVNLTCKLSNDETFTKVLKRYE